MSAYILKSLITLREEITERLMQNTEFRALQSLQRSIDEVSELTRREEEKIAMERASAQAQRLTPASLVREFSTVDQDSSAASQAASLTRVTPAHFATSKRVI